MAAMTFSDADLDAPSAPVAGAPAATSFSDEDLDAPAQPIDVSTGENSQFWHSVGNDEPGYTYGNILPVKKNNNTNEISPAIPEMIRAPLRGIGDMWQMAETGQSTATPDSAAAALALSGLPAADSAAPSAVERAGNFLQDNSSGGKLLSDMRTARLAAKADALSAAKGRNASYAEDIFDNADKMKAAYGDIYNNKAGVASKGVSVNAPAMRDSVDHLHDLIRSDPALLQTPGTAQAFKDLEAVKNSFDENGNIPLDSVTLLQRRVNDLYDPNASEARLKIYNQLNQQLKGVVKDARTDNPEWGRMMDAGKNLFLNYKKTFVDDGRANAKLSLDDKKDYRNWQNSDDPYKAPPSTETQNKIGDLANIKSLADYEMMLRRMSPDLHDQFTQDVMNYSKANNNGSLANKIGALYSAAKQNPLGIAKSLYKMVTDSGEKGIDPALAQSYPHINDAIDYHRNLADNAYQDFLDKEVPDNSVSWLPEQKKLSGPQPQLALPAPEPVIAVDRNGSARPINTDSGLAKSGSANRVRSEKLGLTNDVRAAQDANYKSDLQKRYGQSDVGRFAVENRYEPVERLTNADKASEIDSGAHSGVLSGNPDDEGFKRGGAVPTEAQKMAGNYKKYHVKWQGLNIAIENPAGSERSGIGKDGKKWSVTMPHHYGYLKRTIGADGDHVDCFLGPNQKSRRVYVIDQKDAESGAFDEHKCMISFTDRDAAVAAYRSAFSDKKNRIMKVTRMSVDEFKQWLRHGDTKKPAKRAA